MTTPKTPAKSEVCVKARWVECELQHEIKSLYVGIEQVGYTEKLSKNKFLAVKGNQSKWVKLGTFRTLAEAKAAVVKELNK